MKSTQYTIRSVPAAVDRIVRNRAVKSNSSLNSILIAALERGLGLTEESPEFHDLDDLAGTWVHDPEFDKAMVMFESIDKDLWQ
jgi:hypothetical protein